VGSLGIIVNTVLLSLVGVVPAVWLLFAVLLVGGFGSAALHPVGTSAARLAAGRNKGLAIGLFSAGGMIGFAIGPVVILYVVSTFGLGATPWLMVPGVLLGVLMWFVVPDEERLPGEDGGEEDPLAHGHRHIFDARLFAGPVGLLAVAGILASLSLVTFTSAVPLWLVTERGVAPEAPVIGWTLAAFSFAAGVSGIVSGALGSRLGRRLLVAGSMLLAVGPLLAMFFLEVGSPLFFLAVALAGALVYANLPHMILSAQDLAPHAMGAASGMLMGFSSGVAGLLYIGVGKLQETFGYAPAMALSFLAMVPAALLALYVLGKNRRSLEN
jgi:FSR family fosmidomycin resistance protein-like MFS transporter